MLKERDIYTKNQKMSMVCQWTSASGGGGQGVCAS